MQEHIFEATGFTNYWLSLNNVSSTASVVRLALTRVIISNYEFGRIKEESVVTYLNRLSTSSLYGTDKSHENSHTREPVSVLRFKPETSQYEKCI
jgi:hypothetical protein